MADRSIELQAAIFAALAGDDQLTAILGTDTRTTPPRAKVYDTIPSGTPAPYVVIGDETAIDAGASLKDGQEHTLTLHVWTEDQSSRSCKAIQARVRAVLHEARLTLSAGRCTLVRQDYKDTSRDPDGVSWHGVMRFRARTQD